MSTLRQALADYLTMRRALGFKLQRAGQLLAGFVDYAEGVGAESITPQLAVTWAVQPAGADRGWHTARLSAVRGFARYLSTQDIRTHIIPADVLPGRPRRAVPYLYSDAEIAAVMTAARGLRSPLRAASYATLIGLLAATGMRIGEAIALDRDNVECDKARLIIQDSKFGKSRELPLHPTTVNALDAYAHLRDRLCPTPVTPAWFVSTTGTRLIYRNVHFEFHRLTQRVGLRARSTHCRPRPHDLRHTFAVATLLDWYHDGGDAAARLPLLSTYLGHTNPGSTYWYLSAAPELLALAAQRLQNSLDRQERS